VGRDVAHREALDVAQLKVVPVWRGLAHIESKLGELARGVRAVELLRWYYIPVLSVILEVWGLCQREPFEHRLLSNRRSAEHLLDCNRCNVVVLKDYIGWRAGGREGELGIGGVWLSVLRTLVYIH
jgi:hypothetical protein